MKYPLTHTTMTNETQGLKLHAKEEYSGWVIYLGYEKIAFEINYGRDMGKSIAERIVSCVNAMKDVPDPQQFMDDILVRLQTALEENAQLKEQAKKLVWENEVLLGQMTEAVVKINDLEAEKEQPLNTIKLSAVAAERNKVFSTLESIANDFTEEELKQCLPSFAFKIRNAKDIISKSYQQQKTATEGN